MSGHNKWSKIKRQKGANDLKKGKIFSKLSKMITIAAKGGGDIEMNPTLKLAVDSAKQVNMPSDNIKKAIKKGTGELEGGSIEEVLFEAYGPDGVAMIIEGTTDNNNRTVAEIKHILSVHGGRLGESGSVRWMFEHFGYLEFSKKDNLNIEDLEISAIDAGAIDVADLDSMIVIYVKPDELYSAKDKIHKEGFTATGFGFEWIPENKMKTDDNLNSKIEKLFEALDDHEDVNEVYSNIE